VSASGSYLHKTLLAANAQGLRNLFKLSSLASIEGYYRKWPRMDDDLLEKYHEGIIATTGCPSGAVQTRLRLGQYDQALKTAGNYQDLFGKENYFLELMDHGITIETAVRDDLLRIGKHLGIPLLATNDSHYVMREDAPSQERQKIRSRARIEFEIERDPGRADNEIAKACRTSTFSVRKARARLGLNPPDSI
jgi:DNA polymerase-3 subunit alpha